MGRKNGTWLGRRGNYRKRSYAFGLNSYADLTVTELLVVVKGLGTRPLLH